MELVLDENGNAKLQDGKPLYRHSDGKEIPFDAAATVATIGRLNGEAKGHRERAEKAESALKTFDGLDPAAARRALETVSNLDAKRLIDAGEVDKVKAEASKAYEEQLRALEERYKPVLAERDQLSQRLVAEKIGGAFARSKYISDKLAVPSPMVQATFGGAFKLEGDQIVAFGPDGNKIFSRERPGEVAGFDEALGLLVESSPFRDQILKSAIGSGSGAPGSGGQGGDKTMSRAAFDKLDPPARTAFIRGGGKLHD